MKITSVIAGLAAAAALSAAAQAGGPGSVPASAEKDFGGLDPSLLDARFQGPAAPPRAAETAPAGTLDQWNGYLARNFGGIKAVVSDAMYKGVSTPGTVVERVELKKIFDANLKTRLTFRTSSGNTVYFSGAVASNCDRGKTSCSENDRYFLRFHTDKGQTIFVKGDSVANLFMVKSGEKEIAFDGDSERYIVKLFLEALNPGRSRLKVETQGRGVLDVSLDELTAALRERGKRLESGARHNLYYSSEVLQDSYGNGRFGKGRVLIFSPKGKDPNQTVNISRISPEGVVLDNVEPGLGFRIVDDVLEIYQI